MGFVFVTSPRKMHKYYAPRPTCVVFKSFKAARFARRACSSSTLVCRVVSDIALDRRRSVHNSPKSLVVVCSSCSLSGSENERGMRVESEQVSAVAER